MAHAEAERLQPAVVLEGVFAVEALGPFAGLVAVMVVHGRVQVVVVGIGRLGLVGRHGDEGHAAGQVERRSRLVEERVERGEVDRLSLGEDVLVVEAERPLVVRVELHVERVVGGGRVALVIARVHRRRAQRRAAGRLGHGALQEVAGGVVGEGRARGGAVAGARVETDRVLGSGLLGRRLDDLAGDLHHVVRTPLQNAGPAATLAVEVQAAIAVAARHIDRLARLQVGADIVGIDADGVGAALKLRVGRVQQHADFADRGVPAVTEQARDRRLPLLAQVAVTVVGRIGQDPAGLVERGARAQVDCAADAAFDQVGRGVLVDIDAGH